MEGGYLVLRTGDRTFELAGGDPAIVTPGARVVITATVRTDVATICQLDVIFDLTRSVRHEVRCCPARRQSRGRIRWTP